MSTKLLARNTCVSLLYQAITAICGFIMPRLVITYYGTTVNGLINSITQFLGIITYLDLGISAVVQSALYKPLVENNSRKISEIVSSARTFYKTIAKILLVYVFILILAYPCILKNNEFSPIYTGTLIAAISINSFAQYYFGITDQLLISADQRMYVSYLVQIVTLVVNIAVCTIIIKTGHSIQVVKLTTSLIFLIRPVFYRLYVDKHYSINRDACYNEEPIQQKWNGIAQHVSAVVIGSTDTVVLTLFSTLQNVSIYSVYYLVINGLQKIFASATTGFQSYYGELWAKNETEILKKSFDYLVWVVHAGTVFVFGCTTLLIVPFINIYTKGVADANYNVPVFALFITLAYAAYCIRIPYSIMILAGNHYSQTQKCYTVAVGLNIVVSVITVKLHGLVGVAVGTLIAMVYQTVWMAVYNSNNLVCWPFSCFLKQLLADVLSFLPPYFICSTWTLSASSYAAWIYLAVKVSIIWIVFIVIINTVFYRDHIISLLHKLKHVARMRRTGKL